MSRTIYTANCSHPKVKAIIIRHLDDCLEKSSSEASNTQFTSFTKGLQSHCGKPALTQRPSVNLQQSLDRAQKSSLTRPEPVHIVSESGLDRHINCNYKPEPNLNLTFFEYVGCYNWCSRLQFRVWTTEMFRIILINNATSAALNALDKADAHVVTAHDLFKMAPYLFINTNRIKIWLERYTPCCSVFNISPKLW